MPSPLPPPPPSGSGSSPPYLKYALTFTTGVLVSRLLSHLLSPPSSTRNTPSPHPIRSPLHTLLSTLSPTQQAALPYPPDMFPGARDVETPMGSVRVYEWGPQGGRKVLLVHGISTPGMALGGLAEELVGRGCRVMLFDLFGRGYSDTPSDLAHDARLFITQILLVISTSPLSWTGSGSGSTTGGFHLVGYSLGGGVSMSFTRYLPQLVQSLTLIAPGGLIRPSHIAWKSKLLYSRGVLPEFVLEYLVRRRLQPQAQSKTTSAPAMDPDEAVSAELAHTDELQPQRSREDAGGGGSKSRNSDASGGESYDNAILSARYPHISVAMAVSWQIANHAGFIRSFMSSIRYAPIYAQESVWRIVGARLDAQRAAAAVAAAANGDGGGGGGEEEAAAVARRWGLQGNRVLMVLGERDPVVVAAEVVEDARAVLGEGNVEVVVVRGVGHEVPITRSGEVAEAMWRFWVGTE